MAHNQTLRANVAKQRSRYRAIGAQNSVRAWRARAIKNGEITSIFQPESKRLAPDVRAAIDEAIAAGCVTKVPRGVSGLEA
jgi:hypothetical protein